MDQTGSLGLDEARAHITRVVFADRLGGPEVGSIGLEPEYLVFQLDAVGRPDGRLRLEGERSVLAGLGNLLAEAQELKLSAPGPPPVYDLKDGGRITFEPGGQVEHSTTIHPTAAAAMEDVDRVAHLLSSAFQGQGAKLVSAGLDLWTDRSVVEQQLRAPRYHAMASYLENRSEHGRVMMRHTGSFQVNLDLGEHDVAEERWRLANLLSPISTAMFACSPEGGWKTRRARAWQGLDPSRTGFPDCFLKGGAPDAGACYAELALDADVLLFHLDGGSAVPGKEGFNFRQWIEQGHPEHGFPTLEALDYHLTTLFPEVRLRGFFEMRSTDAIPMHLRAAQVIFWTGLLYDAEARRAALAILEPDLPQLQEQWITAAREGLTNRDLQRRAIRIGELGIEGAHRLPADYFRKKDLQVAKAFQEDYVEAGRSPGDELRKLLDADPRAALDWCQFEG